MSEFLLLISSTTIYTAILIAYSITILGIIGVVVSENRNPVKSLAWITVLLLLPFLGLILYIFFGRSLKSQRMITRRTRRKLIRRNKFRRLNIESLDLSAESKQQIKLGKSLTGAEYLPDNNIQIFTNGKEKFEAFINDLKNARKYINIQYYIFENDGIGNEIKDILIQKAKEGLKIHVIYDHVGCFYVKNSFYKEMSSAGIEVKPFMKVNFPQFATRINWRNHRKITIIDGTIGYIGGMNIADRYINGGKFPYWRDTHLRITGSAVAGLQLSFAIDWNFMKQSLLDDEIPPIQQTENTDNGIQLITSGPIGNWSNISLIMLKAISNAKKYVYVQTPYFLPTESLLKALQAAALSKVDIRIMVPRSSDSLILNWASRSYIKECLNAGVKFYFYTKGMLHSKTMVIDHEFSTVGSTNFDFRSMEHNFESNVFIYSKEINEKMKQIFMDDLEECTRITPSRWRRRPLHEKVMESIIRLFSPIL